MEAKYRVVVHVVAATVLLLSVSITVVYGDYFYAPLYRTIDGSGNNVKNPKWGKANEPFQRIAAPKYDDGYSTFRKSVNGLELSSARLISSVIATDQNFTHHSISHITMQWGQFIDHDLVDTPNPSASKCCDTNPTVSECAPIEVPASDPFYGQYCVKCLKFRRSIPYTGTTYFGFREQYNALTAFLDASTIYGSSIELANRLRLFKDGKLKTYLTFVYDNATTQRGDEYVDVTDKDFLPKDTDKTCIDLNANVCFLSGERRVNQNPGLLTHHVLWMREHNRVATQLKYRNSTASDDYLYYEARKIVIAEMQHITYKEFLPVILGPNLIVSEKLQLLSSGYSNEYNQYIDPTIMNEFSTAAYRFGHNLIQGEYHLRDSDYSSTISKIENLRDTFNNPQFVGQVHYMDKYVRSQYIQGIQEYDRHFTVDVAGHLFLPRGAQYGEDLVSRNIQRGRDHGMPTYNDIREYCGLPRAKVFGDLIYWIPASIIDSLRNLYHSPDDIDLFIGGSVEVPVAGGVVGPTFGCIIAEQFYRLKVGDRFWYENGNQPHPFKPDQLQALRNVTLAGIICENAEEIRTIQPNVFLQPSDSNQPVDCSVIPEVYFHAWS